MVAAARGSVRLLNSGTLLHEGIAAAKLLATDWQVQLGLSSAPSYCELAREAR